MDKYREETAEVVSKATGLSLAEALAAIEIPPDPTWGNYAFPCFGLAKRDKKSPLVIALDIVAKIGTNAGFDKVEAKGPYVNFHITSKVMTLQTIEQVMKKKEAYGKGEAKKQKMLIEYPSPNTNKPLHLGHVRNMLLGQSLSRILSYAGYQVIQTNLNNDRGVHICKAMLAYKLWGNAKRPDKKSDHFVGDFYVMYSKKAEEEPGLEVQVQEMLRLWESGDRKTMKLWRTINTWAIKGFDMTYKRFGIRFDKVYNESEHYMGGKGIVLAGEKEGIFTRDKEGNLVAELEKLGLPNKVLLRADGTSIYMTQDISLAKVKMDDFHMDSSIYVVGSEQNLHFQQLFKILDMLQFPNTKGLYHLSYGMVYLPEGRMKSREGRVVDADDLVDEMITVASREIRERHELSKQKLSERAEKIGMAALRFFILKYEPARDFVYSPEESISFEGETGPYIQYAYARIQSILVKQGKRQAKGFDPALLASPEEKELVRLLNDFPGEVEKAAAAYKPSLIARYSLLLAQRFNEYYHKQPILRAEQHERDARLMLIQAVAQVLRNSLALLGIEAVDEM